MLNILVQCPYNYEIMKTFNEYINEGIFDIEDNIKKGPDWQKMLIDHIVGNKGVVIGGTGCDCLGRKVEPGDWVVFLDAGGYYGTGKRLNIGKVIAVKKQISIALFVPRPGNVWNADGIERISRPSEYVFKINNPEKIASEII